jgi:hypothetical protein
MSEQTLHHMEWMLNDDGSYLSVRTLVRTGLVMFRSLWQLADRAAFPGDDEEPILSVWHLLALLQAIVRL